MLINRNRINETISFLMQKTGGDVKVDAAIVLGTGFAGLTDSFDIAVSIPYRDIPHFPETTVPGHPGILHLARFKSKSIAVMQGRTHLYEGLPIDEMLVPIATMHNLGCRSLVLTNAAGGLDPAMHPGDLMILSDHINMTGINPMTGPNDESTGPRFLDSRDIYDPGMREKAKAVAAENGTAVREGVYLGVTGPSYETPAEIRAFRTLGADAVGMSTVVEALFARYLSMRIFGLSCISNVPAPAGTAPLDHKSVQDIVSEAVPKAAIVVTGLLERL